MEICDQSTGLPCLPRKRDKGRTVRYYETGSNDPDWNLAFEEYLFRHHERGSQVLILWQNKPSVILGRYQNAAEETDGSYAREHGIEIVRRMTGGGAVYHDWGNLNYTVITDVDEGEIPSFAPILQPVLSAIRGFGIRAELSGRNDIVVRRGQADAYPKGCQGLEGPTVTEGKKRRMPEVTGAPEADPGDFYKVSGNSRIIADGVLLQHGTLLVNSDLTALGKVLTRKNKVTHTMAAQSVRSRVANLSEFAGKKLTAAMLMDAIKTQFGENSQKNLKAEPGDTFPGSPKQEPERFIYSKLTQEMLGQVRRLQQEKYQSWEWNSAGAPPFSIKREVRCAAGLVCALIQVERGQIQSVQFEGDFLFAKDPDDLAEMLKGRNTDAGLEALLREIPAREYIPGMTQEQFLSLFCF
mgnify:CR=1 FL=1